MAVKDSVRSVAADVRNTMRGSDGALWFDAIPAAMLQSAEFKVTPSYDDVIACGDPATYQTMNGRSGTGSIKLKKICSNFNKMIADEIHSGIIRDHSITTRINSPSGQVERIKVMGVTFDEVTLQAFEAGKIMEDEYPIHFADWCYLDQINL